MRASEALGQLARHQDQIVRGLALMDRLVAAGPHELHAAQRLRWELGRHLRAYQLFKHNELFDPAIAAGRLVDADHARTMKARCTTAGEAYRAFMLEWSGRDAASEWDAFADAWRAMAARLREHLAQEKSEIARSLEQVEDTRRRA